MSRRSNYPNLEKMASDTSLAPIPLIYCSGSGDEVRGELQDHIVSISSHPSRDLLGVGDIVGNITLYVSGSFYFYDLYLISLWPAGHADILTEQVSSAAR